MIVAATDACRSRFDRSRALHARLEWTRASAKGKVEIVRRHISPSLPFPSEITPSLINAI